MAYEKCNRWSHCKIQTQIFFDKERVAGFKMAKIQIIRFLDKTLQHLLFPIHHLNKPKLDTRFLKRSAWPDGHGIRLEI